MVVIKTGYYFAVVLDCVELVCSLAELFVEVDELLFEGVVFLHGCIYLDVLVFEVLLIAGILLFLGIDLYE